ncbi:ComEC/Rec2 family competence protein [Roseibacillus persicicus]|uniref:ComEC/Rec2 family competence protein n=1 Tax=Roseibacillus persicicus TaxID=454148 RepID=UPI00398AD55B
MKSGPLPALGRCPLLLPFVGAVLGILVSEWGAWALLVAIVTSALFGGLWRFKPTVVAAALITLAFAILHDERRKQRDILAEEFQRKADISLSGTLLESNRAGLVRRLFETDEGALLTLDGLPREFRTGQRITLMGTPHKDIPSRNPAGWDPRDTLWKRGIAGSVEVTSAEMIGWSHGFPVLRGWSEEIRLNLIERLTNGIENRESAEVVQAVILGEKSTGSRAFDDFRKTGTMHVFAVSGLHVGLVALIAFGVGKLLRLPPRVLIWAVLFAMFGYAFITGLRPPALRASLMGALLLGRFLLLRRPSVVNNLFAAAIVVLFLDSFQLWQAGFQLSFLVVGVILLLEPLIWRRVEPHLAHDPYLPKPVWSRWQRFTDWSRNKVGKMFTVSLAAWSGSAPLSVFYFGWFTPIASFASVLMVMVAFLILCCAFLSLTLGSIAQPVALKLNAINGELAHFARHSAATMSNWPGAWMRYQNRAEWEEGMCVLDIPYGGAAIHLDAGGGVLIDAGSESSFWWIVDPALEAYGLSCDSLIATHNDAAHIGGLEEAARSFPVGQALVPRESERYSLAELVTTCREENITLHYPDSTPRLPVDEETWIEVLHPGNPLSPRSDDRGIVVRIFQNGWSILVTADTGYETEKALLESGKHLQSDLWICGRNQRDSMGHDAFVNAVAPKAIIATEQSYPEAEQIPPVWKAWLENKGVAFFSQKEHGAVFVLPKGNELTLKGYLTGRKVRLTR